MSGIEPAVREYLERYMERERPDLVIIFASSDFSRHRIAPCGFVRAIGTATSRRIS